MFVLGVDPGLAKCGYAVLSSSKTGISLESAGLITTDQCDPLPRRLREIYVELKDVMEKFEPDVVVVERIFFQKNVKTAIVVAQASGAAFIAAAEYGITVEQLTSNEVKLALAGSGGASKYQLQRMVQLLLGLDRLPKPPDVVDAIGLAYSYLVGNQITPLRAVVS